MRNFKVRTMASLVGLLLSAGVCLAKSAESGSGIRPKSPSPVEIARVVNKSRRAWKEHFILEVDLGTVWEQLRLEPGDFGACGGDCEARIFRHELDGKPGKESVLKLTKSFNSCRYLIFTRVRFRKTPRLRWKLLGFVDHDFNRYEMASHRVVRALGRNWFVLRGQEGSGSGYSLYGDTWFDVNRTGMKPVLHYSADGQTDPGIGGLKWEFKGTPSTLQRPHGPRAIKLTFQVFYTTKGFEKDFSRPFIVQRHAMYVWDKSASEFVFDHRHSTISEREMNAVANIDTESSGEEDDGTKIGGSTFFSGLKGFVGSGFEMFVRLNVRRLLHIANGEDNRAKEWLREFLKQCDDIPEKQLIERALTNPQPKTSKR